MQRLNVVDLRLPDVPLLKMQIVLHFRIARRVHNPNAGDLV